MIKNFTEALRDNRSYGWICGNAYELTKDELINILKEYDYMIHYNGEGYLYDEIADSIEDVFGI